MTGGGCGAQRLSGVHVQVRKRRPMSDADDTLSAVMPAPEPASSGLASASRGLPGCHLERSLSPRGRAVAGPRIKSGVTVWRGRGDGRGCGAQRLSGVHVQVRKRRPMSDADDTLSAVMPAPEPASSGLASASRGLPGVSPRKESLTARTRGGWTPDQVRGDGVEGPSDTPGHLRHAHTPPDAACGCDGGGAGL
ncbi:hypothetical protein DFR52_103565 [Hoeflea marina]|uniref:Uncharacterized protein n=1 Tax=Hoeflea marina TaxID=274592 RepID=A0A317PPB6_9HYPH|nr:hypothetical protein DFR52_103565 [Hoeflea marina]